MIRRRLFLRLFDDVVAVISILLNEGSVESLRKRLIQEHVS